MGDTPQNKEEGYNKWSPAQTKVLIELLVEGIKRGWRDSSGIINKATVENKILPVLNEKQKCQKTHKHYTSRIKYLRGLYNCYLDLERNSSGFGWDPDSKRFTASNEVWHGYLKAHPGHKFMRYESHEQFDDLKIIFDGTTANGNNSLGFGVTTDACTYEVDDNQVKENLIFCESGDDVTDALPFLDKKQKSRAEKLIPRKRSRTEACKSDNNDFVVTMSNRILDIIQQREERQQREAEKKEAEKKKNSVWNAMKEITNLDQRSKLKAVTLIYSLGMKDVFADMSVEERIGWIQTNIGSD